MVTLTLQGTSLFTPMVYVILNGTCYLLWHKFIHHGTCWPTLYTSPSMIPAGLHRTSWAASVFVCSLGNITTRTKIHVPRNSCKTCFNAIKGNDTKKYAIARFEHPFCNIKD